MIAHVIHDSRRGDRAAMLKEQAELNGFRYRLWPALFFDDPMAHVFGPWRAHKQIVRWAKAEELPCVWICEDDVKFSHPKAIDYFLKNLPTDDKTTIYLGGHWNARYVGNEPWHWSGTHCYIVFARFYDRLLNAPETEPIDVWLSRWHATYGGGRLKVCQPLVAGCYDSLSGTRGDFLPHSELIGERSEFYKG